MSRFSPAPLWRVGTAVFLSVLIAVPIPAQTVVWVGGTNGNWALASNWNPSGVPYFDKDVVINSGSVIMSNLDVENSTSAHSIKISSATLSLSNSDLYTSVDSVIGDTASATVNVNNGSLWRHSATLNVNNGSTLAATGSSSVEIRNDLNFSQSTLSVSSNATVTVNGVITLNSSTFNLSNNGTVTINGAGPVTLNGANNAINITQVVGQAKPGTLNASDIIASAGASGLVKFDHVSSNYTFSPNLSGNISIQQSGANSTTILTGNIATTGSTTINAGTLQIGNGGGLLGDVGPSLGSVSNGGALIFNRSDDVTVSGNISGSGTLTKNGTGTLILSGSSSGYSGATTINAGTLMGGGTHTLSPFSFVTVNSGGTLEVRGPANTIAGIAGAGNIDIRPGSDLAINNPGSPMTFSGVISGSLALNGGSLTLTGNNSASVNLKVGAQLQVGVGGDSGAVGGGVNLNGGTLTFNRSTALNQTGPISGNGTLTKLGTGALTLGGDNSYTGNTTISGGSIIFSGGSNRLGNATNVFITNGSILDLGGYSQNITGLGNTGTPVVGNITNGTLTLGNSGGNIYLRSGTFNDVIFNGGNNNGRLWIGGDANATVTLNGTNDLVYASDHHGVVIGHSLTGAAGTVKLGKAESLTAASETVEVWSGTLDLNGVSGVRGTTIQLKSGASSSLINDNTSSDASFANNIVIDSAGSTLGGAGNLTLTGSITGDTLNKIGAGMLTTYGGNFSTTNISGGTLRLTGGFNNRLGPNSNVSITNGATLDLDGNSQAVSNLSVAGNLNNGTIALNAGSGGAVYLQSGTITNATLTNGNASNARLWIGGDPEATVTLNGTNNMTYFFDHNQVIIGYGGGAGSINRVKVGNANALAAATENVEVHYGMLDLNGVSNVRAGSIQLKQGANSALINDNTGSAASYAGPVGLALSSSVLGGDGNLTLSGNLTGAGDFNKTGGGTLKLTGNNTYTGNTILSNGTLALGGNNVLSNGTLTINGGEIRAADAARTISNPVTLSGSFALGRLTHFSGNISVTSGVTITAQNSDGPANADNLFTSLISGAGSITIAEGPNGIGTGAIQFLNNSSTYSGGTIINSGRLAIGNDGALGAAGAGLTINNGTLLAVNSITSTRPVTLGGNATIDVGFGTTTLGAISGSGSLTKNGTGTTLFLSGSTLHTGATMVNAGTLQIGTGGTIANLTGNVAIASGASLTLNHSNDIVNPGILSGTGSFTQTGSGMLTLSGNSTHTGTLSVASGALQVGNGTASGSIASNVALSSGTSITFNRSNDSAYPGVVSGSGSFTKTGAGTLTLSNANTFTGNTTISGGSLLLSGGANRLPSGTNITLTNGASLDLGNTTQTVASLGNATTRVVGNVTNGTIDLKPGAGSIFLQNGTFSNVTLTGNHSAARIWIGGDANATVTLNGTNDMVFQSDHNQVVIGHVTTGGAGTVKVGNANALAAATENVEVWGGTLDLNGVSGVRAGSIQMRLGAASSLINGNTGSAASFGNAVGIADPGTLLGGAGDLTLSGNLTGAGGFNKTGAGTLTLSGSNNTYSGGTTLTAGILGIGADNALGTGTLTINGGNIRAVNAARTVTNNVTLAGNFTLGRSTTLAGPVTLTNNIVVTSSNPGGASGGALSTVSGNIGGSFGLTFTEGINPIGTIALTGTNNYTGGTTVNAGTVQIGNGGTTGSLTGNVAVNSGGSLALNRSDDITFANVISGSGSVVKNGAGGATLTGNNTFSGGVTLNAGTLGLGADNALGAGTIAINGGTIRAEGAPRTLTNNVTLAGNFTLGRATNFSGPLTLTNNVVITSANPDSNFASGSTFSGNISGGFGLTFTEGTNPIGLITLNGNNSYTGGTTLNAGLLAIGSNSGLGTGTLTLNGPSTLRASAAVTLPNAIALTGSNPIVDNNGLALGLGGNISGSAAVTLSGSGTTTLTGTASHTGGTTVASGTVQVGNGGTTGTLSGNVALNSGSSLVFNRSDDSASNSVISGSGTVVKNGTGRVILSGANSTFSGGLTLNSGILGLGADNVLGTGTLTINGGNIRAEGAGRTVTNNVTVNGNFTLGRATIFSGPVTLTNNIVVTSGNPDAAAGTGSGFNGIISGGFGLTFTEGTNPIGTITLSGANTYTGNTTITAGTLALSGGANRLPTSTNVFLSNGATLNLGGTSQTVASVGSSSNRVVGNLTNGTLSTNAGQVFLQSGTHNATFTGSSSNARIWIGGDANATVTLNGTNDMVFTNDHNQMIIGHAIAGGATGTVKLGNANALAAATENVELWSGTIDFNGQSNVRANSILLKSGSLSALINASGAASYAGSVSLDAGGSFVGGLGDLALGGAISGAGGLNKIGAGRLTLGGLSTYSGGTTITGGTLQLGASNRLASTGAMTLAGGTFATGGFSQTLGTFSLSASSTIDFGSGASSLVFANSSASAWTGTLSILNYTDGQDTLRFGTSNNSLTATQLNQISFGGFTAQIDANGFVSPTAIPEPSTYAILAGAAMLGLAVWRRRRAQREQITPR